MPAANELTCVDIRVALARANIPAYIIAAKVRLHPINLGRILNGHAPLRPDLAHRIMTAIEQEVAAR